MADEAVPTPGRPSRRWFGWGPASGTISNAGDSARGFRVQVTTFDGETAAILGSRSVPVFLEPGQTEPFEMYILDFRDLDGSALPDVVGCVASVFYN